jgi:hypothetical protein
MTDDGQPAWLAAQNDMRFPLRKTREVVVHLCEGCGPHLFYGTGWPVCHEDSVSWYVDQEQDFSLPCSFCEEWERRRDLERTLTAPLSGEMPF